MWYSSTADNRWILNAEPASGAHGAHGFAVDRYSYNETPGDLFTDPQRPGRSLTAELAPRSFNTFIR